MPLERVPRDYAQISGGAGGKTFHTVVNPPDATLRVDVRPDALRVTVTQQGGKRLHEEEIPA